MKKPKKTIMGVLILLLAIGTGGYLWKTVRSHEPADDGLTLYGNVDIRDAQLAFKEQEVVREVLVEEGDTVTQGQILARLDSDRLTSQLKEAEAQYAAQQEVVRRLTNGTRRQEIKQAEARVVEARVQVRNAARRVRRLEKTAPVGASTEQDLDDARASLDMARAALNVHQESLALAREGTRKEEIAEAKQVLEARDAHLSLLRQRLADTVLHAPAKGIILSRILEPGEMAMPTRPAFVLALSEPKWVRAYLPEPALGHIRQGMTARIHSDSFDDRFFDGRVGFISAQAEFTPKSVQTAQLRTQLVYEVRIWTDDPADELRLGMPVTVTISVPPSIAQSENPKKGFRPGMEG
ncbi:efflux RND transporter periplasmic adaptor subunit [Desulfosarcina ovata]|uniref:Membrane protein n=1 Tax=Desulfosarcina ovata subsp. ovata TaxID=2752305 RepID=A0A5K8AB86_9BACT|nr:efflux RND transporter periplasmic adaptor subunit [Desulfosarcina ovata]BBO89210.1 membrane protein [Desulfosarcina ovata subsp. ovata]